MKQFLRQLAVFPFSLCQLFAVFLQSFLLAVNGFNQPDQILASVRIQTALVFFSKGAHILPNDLLCPNFGNLQNQLLRFRLCQNRAHEYLRIQRRINFPTGKYRRKRVIFLPAVSQRRIARHTNLLDAANTVISINDIFTLPKHRSPSCILHIHKLF